MSRIEYPPHIARPATDLVGPMVWFRGQMVNVTHSPPTNTTDPRYNLCTDHRLACDCREAERGEELFELRAEHWRMRDLLAALIAGHATEVYDGYEPAEISNAAASSVFSRGRPGW
ncbi:hypothetical protein ACIBCD_27060 [Nocardia brasiliensis]|uniref:hypothetical protein n=1 Tax=Nocardia brasiliensis TaxID=37326 RepID=UPI00379E68BB